jgi:hypothetical protein
VNYGRTVTLIGAWLRLSVLGDVIVRQGMSGGARMSAGRIIIHLVIKPARIRSRWSHLSTSAVVPPGASNGAVMHVCGPTPPDLQIIPAWTWT